MLSIFVNPAQFAPHEDLDTYPKTLENDLRLLAGQSVEGRTVSAVFAPTVKEMYPSGITQDPAAQKGMFVEVKGFGDEMEGKSRPLFFRGSRNRRHQALQCHRGTTTYILPKSHLTVYTANTNIFRAKGYPASSSPTADVPRSPPLPSYPGEPPHRTYPAGTTPTASRLSRETPTSRLKQRLVAPKLYAALQSAETAWNTGLIKAECIEKAVEVIRGAPGVRLDYVEMNDPDTFEALDGASMAAEKCGDSERGSLGRYDEVDR